MVAFVEGVARFRTLRALDLREEMVDFARLTTRFSCDLLTSVLDPDVYSTHTLRALGSRGSVRSSPCGVTVPSLSTRLRFFPAGALSLPRVGRAALRAGIVLLCCIAASCNTS